MFKTIITILFFLLCIPVLFLLFPRASYAANSGNFTMSLWANPTTSVASKTILGKAEEFRIFTNASGFVGCQIKTSTWQTAAQSTSKALVVGTWSNIICTYDLTTLKVYVNGTLTAQTALTTLPDDTAALLKLGQDDSASSPYTNLSGTIDEFKFYSYALTADEVKTDYNKGSSLQLGAAGNNSTYAPGAANQEYCVPGDTTSCAAPVARWDFEEGTGGTVNDTSGNGYAGTWAGTGSHWTSGKIGKAGSFNGSNDLVDTVSNVLFTTAFTIESWFKVPMWLTGTSGVTMESILAKWNCVNSNCGAGRVDEGYQFGRFYGGTNFGISINNGADSTNSRSASVATSTISTGVWHHAAATFVGGSYLRLFIDGVLVNENTTNMYASVADAPEYKHRIGTFSHGYGKFNGSIDQVRIFNYARTPAQIAWDYNRGGPVGWWKFDECQGAVANDSSGKGNPGTITVATGNPIGTCTTANSFWGGTAGTGTGKRNFAPTFDGTDDYVDTSGPATNASTQTYTVSAWFNQAGSTSSQVNIISDALAAHNNNNFRLYTLNNKIYMKIYNGGNLILGSNKTITTGTWYHVVAVQDSPNSSRKLYINGILDTSDTQTSYNGSFTHFHIGTSGSLLNYFPGQIDDVKIFNYALTATQVKNEYNGGAVNFAPLTGSP